MKKDELDILEYRHVIERLASETTNATYDYEFDGLSNVFDDMSYREHIRLIEKLLSENITEEDRALLSKWHQRYKDLNDKFIFDSVMRKIGKAFNMRTICDMALVPYQSYKNYSSTGKGLSYDNMRKLTAAMGGVSNYVNDIVMSNK